MYTENGPPLKVGDPAARLFEDDPAGCGIPGLKVKFPETIEPACSDIAEVERCGSASPHRLARDQKLSKLADHGLQPLSEVVRETR